MELLPIMYDPHFGSMEENFDSEWNAAAASNVNDESSLRASKIAELKALLKSKRYNLRPGDDMQLMAMLRAANCQVKAAGEVAAAFLEYQKYCGNACPSKVKDMLAANLKNVVVLPHRDKYGRRVIVYKMWDGERFPYKDFMNIFYVISLTLAREPKTQVTGITMVGDMSGMTRKHVPSTWSDITAFSTFMKGGAPVWFHKIHLINAPRLFEMLFSFAKPFLNEKTRGNMVMHRDLKALHDEVDPAILPTEFGGTVGTVDNTGMMEEVLKLEEYFLELQRSSIG